MRQCRLKDCLALVTTHSQGRLVKMGGSLGLAQGYRIVIVAEAGAEQGASAGSGVVAQAEFFVGAYVGYAPLWKSWRDAGEEAVRGDRGGKRWRGM